MVWLYKNEQNENQVARVGEAILTNEDLSLLVYTDKERMSFVDNWVNTELLFQAGVYADLGRDVLLDSKIKQYKKTYWSNVFRYTNKKRCFCFKRRSALLLYKQQRGI